MLQTPDAWHVTSHLGRRQAGGRGSKLELLGGERANLRMLLPSFVLKNFHVCTSYIFSVDVWRGKGCLYATVEHFRIIWTSSIIKTGSIILCSIIFLIRFTIFILDVLRFEISTQLVIALPG